MSSTTTHAAYRGTTSVLTTGLNSLADQTMSAAGTAFDNHTNLDLLCDIQVTIATQGSARAAGATVEVYMLYSFDNSTFDGLLRGVSALVAVVSLDAATTSRIRTIVDVPLSPGYIKFALFNNTGQALAASANTVIIDPHSVLTT